MAKDYSSLNDINFSSEEKISMLCLEIAVPLSAMLGYTTLIKQELNKQPFYDQLPPQIIEWLDKVEENAKDLVNLRQTVCNRRPT